MRTQMKKLLFAGLICTLLFVSVETSYSEESTSVKTAILSDASIYFEDQGQFLHPYKIDGRNYLMLRDLAQMFRNTPSEFEYTWNDALRQIRITTGKSMPIQDNEEGYIFGKETARINTVSILVDGSEMALDAYIINNKTYFGLKVISELTGAEVQWNNSENTIKIYSKLPDNAHRVKSSVSCDFNALSNWHARWQSVQKSYLYDSNALLTLVDVTDRVTISKFDPQYNCTESKSLPFELPLFGGFYSGENYNYLVFGDNNIEEDNAREVIRVVKYDKAFNRINSISIQGGDSATVMPFVAGSSSLVEKGNTLIVHTTRQRYMTPDGLNHQSQLTLYIDTAEMRLINTLGLFQPNHVSHSFDQYVKFDGDRVVLVDHGDAYPRSVVMNIGNYNGYEEVDLFQIPGEIGANQTGVVVGGFEITPSHYLVAMNSIDHSKVIAYDSFTLYGLEVDQRDIILLALSKSNLSYYSVNPTTLYKYVDTDAFGSKPKLIKVFEDKYVVLWQEFNKDNEIEGVRYVVVDSNGTVIKSSKLLSDFQLSDMQPVVFNQQLVWYVNRSNHHLFYTIPFSDL